MCSKLKSPTVLGGFGTVILTTIIFFAQGGFINMNPLYIVGFAVGLGLIIYGLVKIEPVEKHKTVTNPLEDIKSDLTTMNICEREIAIKKGKQPCPEEAAIQISDDFTALFGDITTFAISIIQNIIINHDVEPLIDFYKKVGDILDSNNYGLKTDLENVEVYKSSRIDLDQKKLKLKMRKKKRDVTQGNVHRVSSLTYGLNSSILLRYILNSIPEAKRRVPTIIRVTLEGIETTTEKVLTKMLNDLDKEWKVTVNFDALLPNLAGLSNGDKAK